MPAPTYTRLPPREDFAVPSFDFNPQSTKEVKLSESATAKLDKDEEEIRDDLSNREGIEENVTDCNLGISYGRYEVFEVNSDFEDEEEDDYGTRAKRLGWHRRRGGRGREGGVRTLTMEAGTRAVLLELLHPGQSSVAARCMVGAAEGMLHLCPVTIRCQRFQRMVKKDMKCEFFNS